MNFRVLPNDIDISKITNDRYIALMDLGRMDVAFRVGLLGPMFKRKTVPLATFDTIRFRYPLKVFQKYQLKTRVIWWDDSTFYFKQNFERKGRVLATGYVCATLLASSGPVSPQEILSEVGQLEKKPRKPKIVSKLIEMERMIHESQKD